MRQAQRAPFLAALHRVRQAAYPAGEYVGPENFMRAGTGRRARIGPGVSVFDLRCGVGGAGRLISAKLGCHHLRLDYSSSAVEIARRLAGDLPRRFERAQVPALRNRRFEVVLLLETMLAFPDKRALVADAGRMLGPEGRFAFTIEEGRPLTPAERARMPDADTGWLIEWAESTAALPEAGFPVIWQERCTAAHHATAAALLQSFRADSVRIARRIGTQAAAELITAHQLWSAWLSSRRVGKFALEVEKQ